MAIQLGDVGLLAAIVDPSSGQRAFPDAWEKVGREGWQIINGDTARETRKKLLHAAPYMRGGIEIHDLSYNRPLTDLFPRRIKFDIELFSHLGPILP